MNKTSYRAGVAFNVFHHVGVQWPRCWQQLAVMLDAGLSIEAALRVISNGDAKAENGIATRDQQTHTQPHKKTSAGLRRAIGLVQRGVGLSDALQRANCLKPTDFSILSAAERAGCLPEGLQYIAQRRLSWLQRIDTLQAKLWLAKALLLVGALVALFIRVASQNQSPFAAFLDVSIMLIAAWMSIAVLLLMLKVDAVVWLSLTWPMPWFRRRLAIVQWSFEQRFYRMLMWLIAAGVPADQSLDACRGLLNVAAFQRSLNTAEESVARGISLANSVEQAGLVLSHDLRRVMRIANHSGDWDNAVQHTLALQQQRLTHKVDDFFAWLPRVVYLLAVLAVAHATLV